MTDSFLHVGSSDVIGREICNNWDVQTCSHSRISDFSIYNYDVVSISAFDPKRKLMNEKNCEFLGELISRCNENARIVYFSSCRVLDFKFSVGKKTPYVLNKLADENRLLRNFSDVCVVYLPNIIPTSKNQKSRFFEQFFSNLSNNIIRFDVVDYSRWNFVQIQDVLEQVFDSNKLGSFEQILSPTDLTVASLAQKFAQQKTCVEFGDRYEKYPRVKLKSARFCKSDTAKDLSWLDDVGRIYGY